MDEKRAGESKTVQPDCFYPQLHTEPETKKSRGLRKSIRHSVYKLAVVAKLIQGKHLYDAQTILSNVPRKAAEIMRPILNNARSNGVRQGMAEDRMFVKTVICGKGIMYKKMDIKGRSRMGIIKVPKCSVKILVEEKSPHDYYKMLLKGECPP